MGVTLSNDLEWSKHIGIMTNKANFKLSFLCHNMMGCTEKLKQTLEPLSGTHTKNTKVIKLRGCSIELKSSLKAGKQDTLVLLICLMNWDGRLFVKGNRRLD